MEADNTTTRMRAAVAHRHAIGRHTGGPAPFRISHCRCTRWRQDSRARSIRNRHRPAHGRAVPIGRRGCSTLATELRRDGVPTPKSPARLARQAGRPDDALARGTWDATTVRRLLTSDRLAGRVTHKGKLVTDANGLPLTHYEPVLRPDVIDRIRTRLAPASRPAPARRAERLLSGVAYCATCDGRMWAGTGRGGVPIYRCAGRGWNTQRLCALSRSKSTSLPTISP